MKSAFAGTKANVDPRTKMRYALLWGRRRAGIDGINGQPCVQVVSGDLVKWCLIWAARLKSASLPSFENRLPGQRPISYRFKEQKG